MMATQALLRSGGCPAIARSCAKHGSSRSMQTSCPSLIVGSGKFIIPRHTGRELIPEYNSRPAAHTAHRCFSVRAQSTAGVATREGASTKLLEQKSTLPEEQLIKLAKEVLAKNNGLEDPSLLAEDFVFAAPVIYLKKQEFIGALGRFKVKDAFPDVEPNAYNFFVDPYEANRVWFFTRTRATHTGVLNFGAAPIEPTNKRVESPPEVSSLTFNSEGKATRLTAGYVVDRRMGNTGGLGALFGILYAIGAAPPVPEFQPYKPSWQFALFPFVQKLAAKFQSKK